MCAKANPLVRHESICRQVKSTARSSDDVVETCLQFFNWLKSWSIPATGTG